MCRAGASHGVRWCRSSLAGLDHPGRGAARNIPSASEPRPPATLLELVCLPAAKCVPPSGIVFLQYWAWFHLPNIACVFRNRAIARKLSGAGDVQDCFLRPCTGFGIERAEPFLCIAIRAQVREIHIVIALGQEHIAQGSEYSWLIAAEVVGENQVKSGPGLRLVFVMPLWIVPGATVLHLLHGEPEQEHVLFSGFLRHFNGRTVAGSGR